MTKIKNDFTDKQYRYEILLSQAIDEFKKVNKIMGVEFADRLKKLLMSITTVVVMKRMPTKSLMMLRSSLHSCCLN